MNKDLEFININEWGVFPQKAPYIIAGPCSAESKSQIRQTAEELKNIGVTVFRAGLWKPRTRPNSFEGMGEMALTWLSDIQKDLGLTVCTEVATQRHCELCLKAGLKMLWIGARTTSNPFLMQDIADTLKGEDLIVLVKNPISQDLGLWIGAIERLNLAGIKKIGAIHRGFTSTDKIKYRNDPAWQIAVELKTIFPDLALFTDPSHIAGKREFVKEISQRAMSIGFEGLMIESHNKPNCALSDSEQQLSPLELKDLLVNLSIPQKNSDNPSYTKNLNELRAEIDIIDENILRLLKARMEISKKIGLYKKENKISILQYDRWTTLLENILQKGKELELSSSLLNNIFQAIHQDSVNIQEDNKSFKEE